MQAPSAQLPAAHSMDTEWFAIDGQGHVAVFDSGEGGGVPNAHFVAWHEQSMWDQLLVEMLGLAPPGGIRFVADGVFDRAHERSDFRKPDGLAEAYAWETSALIELAAPRELGGLEARLGSAYILGCERPLVYVSRGPAERIAAAWHELGVVRTLLSPGLTPARFGVYVYDNDDYSGGPYQRTSTPIAAALRVESLATGLRRRLEQVRLAGADFSSDAAVQPFEHLPSTVWGQTWIGTDGSVHDVE